MKKLIILLCAMFACDTYINSMSGNSSLRRVSSTSNTDQIDTTNFLKIPMPVEEDAIVPDGIIRDKTLYVNLNALEPILTMPFKELAQKEKPLILAVVTTKSDGKYTYRIYDASATQWFYGENFSINRYALQPDLVKTDPVNKQQVINEVKFFMLPNADASLEYIGSDYDLFKGDHKQQDLLLHTLRANSGRVKSINDVGTIYEERNRLDLAEKYYKYAINKGNSSAAMYNLAEMYRNQHKLTHAKKYYHMAIEKGDGAAAYQLASMYDNGKEYERAARYYQKALDLLKPPFNQIQSEARAHAQKRIDEIKDQKQ